MERVITVEDIRKCREAHKNEFNSRLWKWYFWLTYDWAKFSGPPKELCFFPTCAALYVELFLGVVLSLGIRDNLFFMITISALLMLLVPSPVALLFVAYKRCEKFTIWDKGMTIILDHFMLGRPLLSIRYKDGKISNDPGTLRLLKNLRAYILDDEENVETELLKDVEFLFHCIWGTKDTAPLTKKLEYTIGYFDRCGRPKHTLKGTVYVQGELLPDIVHKECVKDAGIGADEVENDLWLSEGYSEVGQCSSKHSRNKFQEQVQEQEKQEQVQISRNIGRLPSASTIVGVSYSRFKDSFPRIMLVMKKNYVKSTHHQQLNSTALKFLKNVTDDENPCCICYNATENCIICTHCHRPVICEDCADEMMKLRIEQGFKCPNCRGRWSEIIYKGMGGSKPAIHSGLFNELAAQAAKTAEIKEGKAAK